MKSIDLPVPYVSVQGPKGLYEALSELLTQAHPDNALATKEHYILYELGSQQSLIKVDVSQLPFHFWYYDLLGRPATRVVKETIAKFLWEKGGERERFYNEFQGG